MSKSKNDKTYQDLLIKMQKEFNNSEVIQCFVKTEINRALNGDVLSYEQIKAIASNFKKEISQSNRKHDDDTSLH